MSSKCETMTSSNAGAIGMAATGARMLRRRASRLMAIATAALACAQAAGCLGVDDIEALPESDDLADLDGALLDDGIAVPAIDEPAGDMPEEPLGFQGAKGEAGKPKPGAGDNSVSYHQSWSYTWRQGDPAVDMGSYTERFCFLTAVQGKFEGGGESVHVYESGGRWLLAGSSLQNGVGASAVCIPRSYYGQILVPTDEYFWTQEYYPTPMVSDTSSLCFLTAVSGEFDGGGEQVEIFRWNGKWHLGGHAYKPGIVAGARCVNTLYSNGPHHWSQEEVAPKPIADANWWVCGLTRMTGAFEGDGEQVRVRSNGAWWELGGQSYQHGVATSAYCL